MELNSKAWEEWFEYRKGIKHPIKAQSIEPMKLKLMRFGDDQQAVVDQSIAQGWQGLFAITPAKPDPSAPKKRTREQEDANNAQWEYLNRQSIKDWEKIPDSPIKRLNLAAAYLARLDTDPEQGSLMLSEKRSALRDAVAALLREADASLVIADLNLIRLVIRLFNKPGLNRLQDRAEQQVAA